MRKSSRELPLQAFGFPPPVPPRRPPPSQGAIGPTSCRPGWGVPCLRSLDRRWPLDHVDGKWRAMLPSECRDRRTTHPPKPSLDVNKQPVFFLTTWPNFLEITSTATSAAQPKRPLPRGASPTCCPVVL